MRVETENNEIKLTFSNKIIDLDEIQSFIEYVKFREINNQSKATQQQADELANDINQNWWDKNKYKFEK
ncbi:MAG: hypothetical protein K9H26_12075 [Prolixibacteraceae bacterium]|nr:hypothetical protein [Prolixibacteraceae bacterium]